MWVVAEGSMFWKRLSGCAVQELWLDKAAVCISMGLYQPARILLAEAHMVAKVREDTHKCHELELCQSVKLSGSQLVACFLYISKL